MAEDGEEGTSQVVRSGAPSAEVVAHRPRAESSLPARGTLRIRVFMVVVVVVSLVVCMRRGCVSGPGVPVRVRRAQVMAIWQGAAGQRAANRSWEMPANLTAT